MAFCLVGRSDIQGPISLPTVSKPLNETWPIITVSGVSRQNPERRHDRGPKEVTATWTQLHSQVVAVQTGGPFRPHLMNADSSPRFTNILLDVSE